MGLSPSQDPNFMDVTEALNARAITYYICAGTLLRLHRDGQLSPNGGDIDVWFPQGAIDSQTAVQLLEDLGFRTIWAAPQNLHGFRDGGRSIDFQFPFMAIRQTPSGNSEPHQVISWDAPKFTRFFSKLIFLKQVLDGSSSPKGAAKRLVTRDFRAFRLLLKPINAALLDVVRSLPGHRQVEFRIPSSFVEVWEEVNMGGVAWYQPRDVELVLESLYGEDWRLPRSRGDCSFLKEAP